MDDTGHKSGTYARHRCVRNQQLTTTFIDDDCSRDIAGQRSLHWPGEARRDRAVNAVCCNVDQATTLFVAEVHLTRAAGDAHIIQARLDLLKCTHPRRNRVSSQSIELRHGFHQRTLRANQAE